MNVTFTLTAATSGTTAATSFNISGTTSGNTTTELATGVTKNQLTTGYTINSVNDAITGGTIASTCSCNTTTTWSVIQPTPTPTPTATPGPKYDVYEVCHDLSQLYIVYTGTHSSKGLANGTSCSTLLSGVGGIDYATLQTDYPSAMPMSSFTNDPTCACN